MAGAAAVVLFAAGTVVYVHTERRRNDRDISVLKAKVASLTEQVNRDNDVAPAWVAGALAQRNHAPSPDVATSEPLPSGTAPVPSGAVSADRASRPAPERGVVRDGLEVAFVSEERDPKWGTLERGTMMKKFDGIVSKESSITSLDCRVSMCRMQTQHQDRQAYQKFIESAFMDPAGHVVSTAAHVSLLSDPSAQGPMEAVMFVAREGHTLPVIPRE